MSDFFDAFRTPVAPSPSRFPWEEDEPRPGMTTDLFGDPMAERDRGWFERAFAPFEAGQQGLYRFTLDVADDGFQPGDVLNAMSHAARYFNPWAEVTPIEADEVRQVFFGEQENTGRWGRFATNMAISLLYDPLLLGTASKAVGLVADGSRALRTMNAITNPTEEVIRQTLKLSREQIGPSALNALRRAYGAEKVDTIGTRMMQYTVNRFWGVPEELKRQVMRVDQDVAKWRTRAFDIFKRTERMGGKEGQDLLARAMESEAFYLARRGTEELSDDALRSVDNIDRARRKAGISEDLFLQAYDDMRLLDDEIGRGLYKKGLIDRQTFQLYEGTHLRRIFKAYEQPLDYLDSIVALQKERPDLVEDVTRISSSAMRKNARTLRGFRPNVRATGMGAVADAERVAASRYFKAGNEFDAHRFGQDVYDWMNENPNVSMDELLGHVKNDMLGGIDMGGDFYAQLASRITSSKYTTRGAAFYENKLRDLVNGHGTGWRAFQERTEIVSKRENIRPELAEILGEVTEAAPRMAAEASDAGRLLEMRSFFDNVAGIRRVDEETGDLIQTARRALENGEEVPAETMGRIEQAVGRKLTKSELLDLDTGSEILDARGNRVFRSGLVSSRKTDKHTYQIPNNPTFGAVAGAWTTPATGMMIRRLEGVGDIHNPTSKIASASLEAMRKGIGHFKMFKVIMDPTAQVRNFVGNAVLMELQGTNPFRVDRMIKSGREVMRFIRTGEMGDMLKLADDAGLSLFQSTFSKNELAQVAERLTHIADPDRKTWVRAYEGLYGAMQRAYRDSSEFMAKSFEFNEMLFKLNVFSDKYDEMAEGILKAGGKLTPEKRVDLARQAGALAEQALFNYADVPYLVDAARKYGVVPFATFPFKAIPYVAETMYKNPWRVLKYERAVGEFNQSFYSGTPAERAREIQGLPQHMREGMVVKLPFSDSEDRPLYMDLSYFMPWYTIKDLTDSFQSEGAFDPGFRSGILTPPAMAIVDMIRRGEDSLGRPIFDPAASTTENMGYLAKWIAEFIAPPSMPGLGSRADSIGKAMMAYATRDPEVADWVGILGSGMRGVHNPDDVFTGSGGIGQTQAQAGVGGTLGAALAPLFGIATGGAAASDPEQAAQNARAKFAGNATDIAREIASVRSSRSLTPAQKRERIARLRAMLTDAREERNQYLRQVR